MSSVELIRPLEFQIVYEGRRRLMHLRAATAALATAWVEALRSVAPLETCARDFNAERYDERLDRSNDEVHHVLTPNLTHTLKC